MTLQRARYNVANSPSKIEGAGGSMISRQDLPLCCIVTVWPIDGIAKVRESTSKRSNASKKLIISNTMQEPRRCSQLGDIQRLMDVPRKRNFYIDICFAACHTPPTPLYLRGGVPENTHFRKTLLTHKNLNNTLTH